MKRAASAVVCLLLAAACTPGPADSKRGDNASSMGAHPDGAPAAPAPAPTPAAAAPPEDTCNKAAYAALVGKSEKDPGVPPAGAGVRRIHPGDQVTMDFRPDRLDIDIDAKGNIAGLRCG